MRKFFTLLILTTIALGSHLMAQPLEDWISAAEDATLREDYYSAYRYYDVAVKYDTSRLDLWYKLAESAQEFTAYRAATNAFLRVKSSVPADSFPLLDFKLAQVLQKRGQYAEAAKLYDDFITNQASDKVSTEVIEEAERNLINAEWANEEVENAADIAVRHLENDVNSPYSDFGLFRKDDTLYYSSMRFVYENDSITPRRELTRILRQTTDGKKLSKLPKYINQEGRMAAQTAFNEAGDVVYYSLCDYQGASSDFRCEIYCSKLDNKNEWSRPERLPVNDEKSNTTQPNVGKDPRTGEPYLYFVSNRPGGKGGLDIYRSAILADGGCGPVEALDEINTTGNDVTPFYYAPTQVLYFSTDGRLSMGGYDIYRSSWDGYAWERPTNMGVPVNTSYNDTYYARFANDELAYLSSNRPDTAAIFWDESKDACCNDIYSLGIVDEFKLIALTFNQRDLTELAGTSVALYEITPNGRRLVDSLHNPTANDFNFTVQPGKKYELVGTKNGYSTAIDQLDMTDPELLAQKEIERRLYLSPGIRLDVFTFDKTDNSELLGTTAFLYEITPEGEMILIDSLVNTGGNDYHFDLERGKKYQVFARKDGFTPDMTVVDTTDPKLANVSEIRRDLYLEPGLVLEVYTYRLLDKLPLTGSTVYLYDYTDEFGEVLVDSLTNTDGNQFWWKVEKGKRYVIRGERYGYGPAVASLDLTGPDVPETGTYRRNLYLGQLLEIFTYDEETEEPLPGAEVRLIDPRTGEIVAERINPLGNDFRFSINLDTPYKLEVRRKGYEPVDEIITFSPEDLAAGNGKIAFDVFLTPLRGPESMLPLLLYFDNDHPNPRTYSTYTNLEYVSTNVDYYQKKQEFIGSFTEGMPLEEAFLTRRRFNDFFDREVRGGRYDLEEFAKRLLTHLENGGTFVMDLQGFASPRAPKAYNDMLSARRIVSVKNFFERYNDGTFRAYLASGALSYREAAFGETKAPEQVVDAINDRRNSVYNIFASLERRVEINSGQDN